MSDFLSDAWIEDLDAKLRAGVVNPKADTITVQYLVTRPDESVTEYHLALGPDGDRAHKGRAETPDVTFGMDEATAAAISAGETSSEEAFLAGTLDLSGDAGRLIDAYRASGDA